MGLLNWLGLTSELPETIDAVSKLYTTDKEKLAGEEKLQETLQEPGLKQMEINKVLASSKNVYLNGWQPLLGWTCGACVALYFVPQMILGAFIWGKLCIAQDKVLPFPVDISEIYRLLGLMIGYGIYAINKKRIE